MDGFVDLLHIIQHLHKGDSTSETRMTAMENREAIEDYFRLLKETLEQHDLLDKPGQIYNVDESGMPLDHRPPHVVVMKGQRKVRYMHTEHQEI